MQAAPNLAQSWHQRVASLTPAIVKLLKPSVGQGTAESSRNPDVSAGDYAMIAVSDTGSGIAPDIMSRVIEPFFTIKPPGHGTTVRIYLPRAVTRPSPTVETMTAEGTGDLKGLRVLLVEDHPGVRDVAVKQLEEFGCEVIEAHDGHAALVLLKQGQKVDLLFTDIVMPGGMTGVELARQAAELRPGLKILFTSGFAEGALQGDQSRIGGRNFLSKPYRKQDLARRIREVLAGLESN